MVDLWLGTSDAVRYYQSISHQNTTKYGGFMLRLLDITKEYKVDEDSVLALHGVSIEFRRNEFVSILGPSGCGKTTLLNIIGGLDRYTSGDIQIDGISTKEYDDVDWDTYRNRRIGFVFQSYNLIPHMNVLKNVSLSLVLAGVDKEERNRRAMEALRKVGLENQAKKKPNQLSGGQMQRVAIARALVNNPEIILADEPTGALDTESGIQVMDLLKEVAKDRLVIMVTHNPQLANDYSTRIVSLKDGEVIDDSMPYDSSIENNEETMSKGANEDLKVNDEISQEAPKKKESKLAKWIAKRKKSDKSSMKLKTAINLSWNNLLSKKGRTFLTSIAGSIGIIGIVMVLALSNGAKTYIDTLEESALSTYPLQISESNISISTIMDLLNGSNSGREKNPDTDQIYINKILGTVMENLPAYVTNNNLKKLKQYMDRHQDELADIGTIKFNYGTQFRVVSPDPIDSSKYMMCHPYSEVMYAVLADVASNPTLSSLLNSPIFNGMTMTEMLGTMGSSMNSWTEMSTNQALLDSQYELIGGKWPTSANEIVVIVDERNQLQDYSLFMLGLKSETEVVKALTTNEFAVSEYTVQDLLNLKYTVFPDTAYLEEVTDTGTGDTYYTVHDKSDKSTAYIDSINDNLKVECKVSGVIRPKVGTTALSINAVVGYTQALTNLLLEKANQHPAVQQMVSAYKNRPATSTTITNIIDCLVVNRADTSSSTKFEYGEAIDGDQLEYLLAYVGAVLDIDNPTSIDVYCYSFDAKEKMQAFIEKYNSETGESVKYSDSLSLIMGYVDTLTTTITGVLVGFAAISLVVSTIMIAIIIYTSVLERKKEIGVLRSIGARKKDVSRVFIAESGILGAYSGAIGVLVSYILSFLVSFILKLYFEIDGLMTVTWWHALMMFGISVVLSIIAGFVPSRIASKKDPAIALRSE